MSRLPDHFDLWVRRAREAQADRQSDWLLGALYAEPEWCFLNSGTTERPYPVIAEESGIQYVLIFSGTVKAGDCWETIADCKIPPPSLFAIGTGKAAGYCLEFRSIGVRGIWVNPGEFSFLIDFDTLEKFDAEWQARVDRRGFWIPNLSSEEEDFWQSNGL